MALSVAMATPILLAGGLKFTAVLGDERFHRPRGGLAERADRLAIDVVGHFPQEIDVFGATVPVFDAV